ncbi:excinuclease ABC subunit UvrC [bacterium]|nr:excinuclease ABC subunit UvrC [bacterium]
MIQKATGLEIIRNFHKNTPNSPGVYRMFDENGKVLYVGKAKNLHKRIKNYTELDGLSERIKKMIHETRKMEIIQTNTENEALIVEQDLIKKLNPKYNILLKDDKSYPYLTISKDEFPKLGKFRGDKSSAFHFFGPFPSSAAVNEGIKIIQSMFGIRTCRDTMFKNRQSPCLLYQIKKCSAPCCLKIQPAQYREQVDKAISFLKGENKTLIDEFSKKMQTASQNRDYETAIIYRDKISYLNQILKKSTFSSLDNDTDIICIVGRDNVYEIEVFFSRKSIICGNFSYFPTKTQNATEEEILYAFIEQFYSERDIPKLILTNINLPLTKTELEETLSEIKGSKVEIDTPQKGEKKKIVDNIISNANAHLEHKFITEINQKKYMDDMQKLFELKTSPKRIDVFDNSHTFGTNKIGAMIVVGPQGFQKDNYRKYNIKSDILGDDYKMMEEVLTRRYTRAKAENTLPDLIIVDGGKGQLDVAHHVLRRLELTTPLVGIAKGENRNAGEETLYQMGKEPINLAKNDPTLFFLQRIRDEAHRFAITTHRERRAKSTFRSALDDIEGIGASKKKALLNYFGSVKNIINANIEELIKVDGINKNLAEKIHKFFH